MCAVSSLGEAILVPALSDWGIICETHPFESKKITKAKQMDGCDIIRTDVTET